MAKNQKQIKEAAYLHHNGESFASIAEQMGMASPTTIFRWSKTETWQTEINDLELLQKEQRTKEYSDYLHKTRKRWELSGVVSLDISTRILGKLRELCDRLDVKELKTPKEQVSAIQALSRGYAILCDTGRSTWIESTGLDVVIEEFDLLK